MLNTLPIEIIEHIVHYLLLLQYQKDIGYYESRSGYINLRTWNEISNYTDLMALAHTCKRFQSAVYPTLFKTLACCNGYVYKDANEKPENEKRRKGRHFLPKVQYVLYESNHRRKTNDYLEKHNSVITLGNSKPQFYMIGGQSDMAPSILHHIQHLSLSFTNNNVDHRKWVAELLPTMNALKEVTLNCDEVKLGPKVDLVVEETYLGFSAILHQLKNHDNKLMLHIYVSIGDDSQQEPDLASSEEQWSDWKGLHIETLEILLESGSKLPIAFCNILGEIKCLKRLTIYCRHLFQIHCKLEIGPWLKSMTGLQDLSSNCGYYARNRVIGKTQVPQELPPSLHRLEWDPFLLGIFTSFDSITHFEAIRDPFSSTDPNTSILKFPVMQSLKTLVLNNFPQDQVVAMLEHFVDSSPDLVNLVLRECTDWDLTDKELLHLASFEHLELYQESNPATLTFKMVIENAPKLRRFIYDCDDLTKPEIPWPWFEEYLYTTQTCLEYVQFRPVFPDKSWPVVRNLDQWCRIQKHMAYGATARNYRGILDEVVEGNENDTLILDVQKLVKKFKKLPPVF